MVSIKQRHEGDNRNQNTFNFLLELDSDTAVSDSIVGNAGIGVVQVLWSHLFYDGSPCDPVLSIYLRPLSESGKAFQQLCNQMKTYHASQAESRLYPLILQNLNEQTLAILNERQAKANIV